jgi:hypothetical protein
MAQVGGGGRNTLLNHGKDGKHGNKSKINNVFYLMI